MRPEDLEQLSNRMRQEWDRRISHDYRYWMSDGVESDAEMWRVGERDFSLLFPEPILQELGRSCAALEIGCGVGRLLRPASQVFERVIGLDVSSEAIARAQTLLTDRPQVELVLGNGLDLQPIPDSSIDVVYSFAAFGSIPMRVVANYLVEIARILTIGGSARLQLFLGREQALCEEDTLSVRGVVPERLQQACELLGLTLESTAELVLPFEASDREAGLIASLAVLKKHTHALCSVEEVLARLVTDREAVAGAEWKGSQTEYYMALYRADEHLSHGRISEAKAALEFAIEHYREAETHVKELLEKLNHTDSTTILSVVSPFERNRQVLVERFPAVAQALSGSELPESFSIRHGASGAPVLVWKNTPLDQVDKPARAAEIWAEQTNTRVRGAKSLLVVGFGGGYGIEALQQRTDAEIHLAVPDPSFLHAALIARDCTAILRRVRSISLSVDALQQAFTQEECPEVVIHPQALVYAPSFVDEVRLAVQGRRGLVELHPNIAVIGPIYGGTLPIAGYTSTALGLLKQRAYGFELSSFYQPYAELRSVLREKRRVDLIEGQFVEFLSQLILEQLSEKPVDIVISMAQAPLSPRVLKELRSRGVITVQWFMEDCRRFPAWQHLAAYYDYFFVIQREFCAAVEQAGAGRSLYLPMACDPAVHRPVSVDPTEPWGSDISFVGAGYNNRQQMFAGLAAQDFKIWGSDWPGGKPFDRLVQEGGRRISPEEYVKIFSASKINLNLHSSSERDGVEPEGDFVNPRTFELAACGAFQLVDERKHLPELFCPKSELVTFRDRREMEDLIQYYLAHPAERQAVAHRARERVLRDHTYEARIRTMLSAIYADRFEQLKSRQGESPWSRTLARAAQHPELQQLLDQVYQRGEEPALDFLIGRIQESKGTLSETEQKLLFLHHVKSQIEHVQNRRNGS